MEATGARLFRGEGRLTDLRTITVGREDLIARRAVVIANGSTAAVPPIPGLDSVDFWTNRQAAIPSELPASLTILGAGAIGVELGQAFARLGSKVTYHGQVIARRLRGIDATADHTAVPRVTYTDPKSRRSDCRRLPHAPKASTSSLPARILLKRREATSTTSTGAR